MSWLINNDLQGVSQSKLAGIATLLWHQEKEQHNAKAQKDQGR